MTDRAVKLWAMKDVLVGCSKNLQAVVAKHNIISAPSSPLEMKPVSRLRVAAMIPSAAVADGARV